MVLVFSDQTLGSLSILTLSRTNILGTAPWLVPDCGHVTLGNS